MLDGFDTFGFSHEGTRRDVYTKGEGPGVVVMHEIPGITPQVAQFSTRVAEAGFTVFMPHLFGTPGQPISTGYALGQMIQCCIQREFRVLAERSSSPITDWLRALCREAGRIPAHARRHRTQEALGDDQGAEKAELGSPAQGRDTQGVRDGSSGREPGHAGNARRLGGPDRIE